MAEKRQPGADDDVRLPEFDYPEYPNWKRGLKWGLGAGGPLALPPLALLAFNSASWPAKACYALAILAVSFLIAGSIGAFRPDLDQK